MTLLWLESLLERLPERTGRAASRYRARLGHLFAVLVILRNKLAARIDHSRLDGGGERVDIVQGDGADSEAAYDMYQLSHLRRYQFACENIKRNGVTADLACGTGYGSVLLADVSEHVYAVDLDRRTVNAARTRYKLVPNVTFTAGDLLDLKAISEFDTIVSFETVEHFPADNIVHLFSVFATSLKPGETLIFSTPLEQQPTPEALAMGFHKTFNVNEETIGRWLGSCALTVCAFQYQSYTDHVIGDTRRGSDFIICTAVKQ